MFQILANLKKSSCIWLSGTFRFDVPEMQLVLQGGSEGGIPLLLTTDETFKRLLIINKIIGLRSRRGAVPSGRWGRVGWYCVQVDVVFWLFKHTLHISGSQGTPITFTASEQISFPGSPWVIPSCQNLENHYQNLSGVN